MDTEKMSVKVTLDLEPDRAAYFIDELESLLAKYAVPTHKYRLLFDNKPEPAVTNTHIEMNAPGL